MKIKYMGHSVVYLETKGKRIIIDPFLNGNPFFKDKIEDIKVDYIIVTHGHSDHLGDTIKLAKLNKDALVISNFEIVLYLQSKGLTNLQALHIGGGREFEFGYLKLTPALHGSSMMEKGNIVYGGNPAGVLIQSNGKTLYHAGDTGLTKDFELLERYHIDVAFLPVGGTFTMDIEDAKLANEMIKPKFFVPIHYDTFDLIKIDHSKLNDIENIKIVNPGETFEI